MHVNARDLVTLYICKADFLHHELVKCIETIVLFRRDSKIRGYNPTLYIYTAVHIYLYLYV